MEKLIKRKKGQDILDALDARLKEIEERKYVGRYYNEFIADAVRELRNGNQVLCFFKYQFDELHKYFGDTLIYKYNKEEKWWECHLEYKKTDHKEEAAELLNFIEHHGLTPKMVLNYIKKKTDVIRMLNE